MPNKRTNPVPSRLTQARHQTGLTQEQVAERAGLSRTSIARYESGLVSPSPVSLNMLCVLYGKPVAWFLGEDEEPPSIEGDRESQTIQASFASDSPSGSASTGSVSNVVREELAQYLSARFDRIESAIRGIANEDDTLSLSDIRPVEVVEVAAAAGGGAETYDETVVGRLWFRRDWLERHAIDPTQCHVISVRGESMEPTLPNGCSILVDRSQGRRQRRDGNIFVMRTEDGLVVKRVSREEDGRWVIESDNPAWEAAPWSEDTEIIGEVRWAARTF